MALDTSEYRLIPLSGDGRVGPQGRVFTLGTADTLSVALAEGYIDELVNLDIPTENRDIQDGHLVMLNHEVGVAGNEAWLTTRVIHLYDEPTGVDTYRLSLQHSGSTLTSKATGTGGAVSETFTGVDGAVLADTIAVTAHFASAPATATANIVYAEITKDNEVTVHYSVDPGAHEVYISLEGNWI